jgi:hypothetical protein
MIKSPIVLVSHHRFQRRKASLLRRSPGKRYLKRDIWKKLRLGKLGSYDARHALWCSNHEIGVRVALGATCSNIIRMVVSEGLWPVLVGIGLGIAGALSLIRILSSLLYGVDRTNPATIVISAVLLAGVALSACYILNLIHIIPDRER